MAMVNLAKLFVQLERAFRCLKQVSSLGYQLVHCGGRDNAVASHGQLKLGPRTVLLGYDDEKALYEHIK